MSAGRAASNFKKVEGWLKGKKLSEVPRNQFRGASRTAICKAVRISLSTTNSNPKILELFAALDLKLLELDTHGPAPVMQRASSTTTASAQVPGLDTDQLREELFHLRRLQYLEQTGICLK
jgi:hypothetical protein